MSLNLKWTFVYKKFLDIVEHADVDSKMSTNIETQVDALYAQHKGEPAWDEAYRRWCETENETEEQIMKTNPWDLYNELAMVLTDVGLGPKTPEGEALLSETLSVQLDRKYDSTSGCGFEFVLGVHLTTKGFDLFMERVCTRAELIGETVDEPVSRPMTATLNQERVSWHWIPGIEFFTLKGIPADPDWEDK